MPTTTSSYFNKFAKYAFIAFALTGTAYYAYKQGYLQEDDFDGTNLSPLEDDDEKEEEDNTEEEEDKEETFDDESVELETANLKRRGARGKPPRSPPPPSLSVRNRVKEAEELEGKNGTTSRSEREARKLSKGHRNDMKRGFLNEKKLSSSGLFGDGDDEGGPLRVASIATPPAGDGVQETPRKPGVFGLWRPLSRSDSSRFGSFLDR